MRYLFCGLLVLAPTAAWADDNAAVKELLDKVVKAHGGADKATEFGSLTFKGTVKAPGGKANFKAEASMDGLDRIRLNLTATVTNESATFVWDGDKMWAHATARNQTEELRGEAAQMMLSSVLAMRLAGLPTSMASSKELHLAHGGEAKVGETDAVILRVSRKDRPDILLYYDKKTYLPLKSEFKMTSMPRQTDYAFVFQFSDFRAVDGVMHFTRVHVSSNCDEMITIELSDFKPGAKFEANTFDKP